MKYKLKVLSIEKDKTEEQNNVEIQILNEDEVLSHRKFGFPSSLTEEELRSELNKYLECFKQEEALKVVALKQEAKEQKLNQLQDNLVGKEI